MQPLTLSEFCEYAKYHKRIAIHAEITVSRLLKDAVIHIYNFLTDTQDMSGVIMENLCHNEANYSYICLEPIETLKLAVNEASNPLVLLKDFQARNQFKSSDAVSHLVTSIMGFMSYDIIRYFENIPTRHVTPSHSPILLFNAYAICIIFDFQKQTILLSLITDVSDRPAGAYKKAQQRLNKLSFYIQNYLTKSNLDNELMLLKDILNIRNSSTLSNIRIDISDNDFIDKIKTAKGYIKAGDIFQVVLSRNYSMPYTVSPLKIYQVLRTLSPTTPYFFYLPIDSKIILGASPECMLAVVNNKITINPIAGTRNNFAKSPEDILNELLQDEKELAEHMMLVDIARNDLGAVSEPGSVKINELMKVKHYSHVSHITSTVQSKLDGKYDAFDALKAAFPAGTLSGAPKIRAMEIIDELETSLRGLYGGVICRFDAVNNLDSCIAIRFASLENGLATIRAGAGIVYDSDPLAEADETYRKAQSLLQAISVAEKCETSICY